MTMMIISDFKIVFSTFYMFQMLSVSRKGKKKKSYFEKRPGLESEGLGLSPGFKIGCVTLSKKSLQSGGNLPPLPYRMGE